MPEASGEIHLFLECSFRRRGERCSGVCPNYVNPEAVEYDGQDDFVAIWERTKEYFSVTSNPVTGNEYFLINADDPDKVPAQVGGQEYISVIRGCGGSERGCGTLSVDIEAGKMFCYSVLCGGCSHSRLEGTYFFRTEIKPKVIESESGWVFDLSGKNYEYKNWIIDSVVKLGQIDHPEPVMTPVGMFGVIPAA